jgi:CheY-like chemotaxis protein
MKKILIVDDQNTIRSILKEQLAAIEDIAVIEAVNGNQAMGKAKVAKPALILLDLIMPKKDGFETIKELKEYPGTKDIPIIVVSAYSEKENINKAMELGATKFIDKEELNNIDFVSLAKGYL